LQDGETFFTLQSLGPVIWPHRVQNREAFVTGMEQEGYRVKDTWECPESKINIIGTSITASGLILDFCRNAAEAVFVSSDRPYPIGVNACPSSPFAVPSAGTLSLPASRSPSS
jgi:hypothetical protein